MRFVFNNLLSNAIKYSPSGGAVVIEVNSREENVLLTIKDNGIGIPPEEADKIFESFYRTKNALDLPGTGLGLAIVKRAVELHGGDIAAQSELNSGTTFRITIPIKN